MYIIFFLKLNILCKWGKTKECCEIFCEFTSFKLQQV